METKIILNELTSVYIYIKLHIITDKNCWWSVLRGLRVLIMDTRSHSVRPSSD